MKTQRPIANWSAGRWGAAVLCLAAWVAFAALLAGGCGSAEKRYRVLSFFFDGVPDPNAPAGALADAEDGQNSGASPRFLSIDHKPYVDGNCEACHVGAKGGYESYLKVGSEVCLKCHQNVLNQYPVMHGPVVAVECNLCHAPHESSIPGLLNEPAPTVCVQCHDRDLLSHNPPEHLVEDSPCLKCHVAHGSTRHGLLRPTAPPATTMPAEARGQ